MICVICGCEIAVRASGWARGHNAEPVAEGRCCRACNDRVVTPARMRGPGQIPKAVWSGVISVFGVDLRCSVLDDGRRVIDAEDSAKLFAAMEDDAPLTETEAAALAAFMRWQGGG
jgi:hypothetical protein